MSNFGLPGTGELLFRSYGGFLKDGANHFGEIGIDVPSVHPLVAPPRWYNLGVGTFFSHRMNPRDPARYRGV